MVRPSNPRQSVRKAVEVQRAPQKGELNLQQITKSEDGQSLVYKGIFDTVDYLAQPPKQKTVAFTATWNDADSAWRIESISDGPWLS